MLQVLIVVDVEGPSIEPEVTALLPDQRDNRIVLRLTEHGAPRVERHGPGAQPIDWMRIGRAIEVVSQKLKEAVEASSGDTLHVYVAGTGPLPIFVHLGYAISKFMGTQWVIGRRPGAAWEVLPLAADVPASDLLTEVPLPARPSPATGEVAVYLDVAARPLDADLLRAAVELGGERLADVIELRPSGSITMTSENTPALAFELTNRLAELLALYPHRSALGVFVAGPTVFALAVGRALNPNIVGTVSLYQHSPGRYDFVYELPFVDYVRPSLPMDDASTQGRADVREAVVRALDALKQEIVEADLDELIP
ncbi:MAG: SAVED domain-containing protein, partial [bacterium]